MTDKLQGVPVSPGAAVARAFLLDDLFSRHDPTTLDAAAVSAEVHRFERARAAAADDLDAIIDRVTREVGDQAAAIFRSHRLLLFDPALVGKVTQRILSDQLDATSALRSTLDEYDALFAKISDLFLRERMADIRDVIQRIQAQLVVQQLPECPRADEPVILAAPEILPSQAVMFDRMKVVGIATETGGTTGHAAILARSLGIPAVSGFSGLLKRVRMRDLLALDGYEGVLHINPGHEIETAYRKLQREHCHRRDRLVANRDLRAVSRDDIEVELLANVNNATDAANAVQAGAVGVGLYRTEYLFLTHPSVPDEDEQLAAYRTVVEASPNRRVTIRTIDLGGDKQLPYFGSGPREANPFMGWRSVRLSTTFPEFFQTQLRAILRAAVHGEVKLLFPMISTVEEVRHLKGLVRQAAEALELRGVPFRADVPIGVMVEVPAAAVCIDDLLDEVDFVSIGSNDLIQYLMAADRDNPKVAHLCEPFSPAIFRVLQGVIRACDRRHKPVTLCGEMAGRPRCVLPLLAMGLRKFSTSPAFVPSVKETVRSLTLPACREVLDLVLPMRTMAEVKAYLTQTVKKFCPEVAIFDTFE